MRSSVQSPPPGARPSRGRGARPASASAYLAVAQRGGDGHGAENVDASGILGPTPPPPSALGRGGGADASGRGLRAAPRAHWSAAPASPRPAPPLGRSEGVCADRTPAPPGPGGRTCLPGRAGGRLGIGSPSRLLPHFLLGVLPAGDPAGGATEESLGRQGAPKVGSLSRSLGSHAESWRAHVSKGQFFESKQTVHPTTVASRECAM